MRKLPFLAFMLLCLCLLLCACGQTGAEPEKPDQSSAPEASAEKLSQMEVPAPTESAASEAPQDGGKLLPLVLYFGDDNCEYIISERVMVEEVDPQIILDALYEKGVLSEPVQVNCFTQEQSRIKLDVSGNYAAMIRSMGTSGEYILLGSLVNSFLTAYQAEELELLVDGEILETGHNIYDYALTFYL